MGTKIAQVGRFQPALIMDSSLHYSLRSHLHTHTQYQLLMPRYRCFRPYRLAQITPCRRLPKTNHGLPGNPRQATRGVLVRSPPAYGKGRTEHELAGPLTALVLLAR
jgi:hypothetical protein